VAWHRGRLAMLRLSGGRVWCVRVRFHMLMAGLLPAGRMRWSVLLVTRAAVRRARSLGSRGVLVLIGRHCCGGGSAALLLLVLIMPVRVLPFTPNPSQSSPLIRRNHGLERRSSRRSAELGLVPALLLLLLLL
jgi:hypothetical protein